MINHTQFVVLMILASVAGLCIWWSARSSWSAPVPLDDEPERAPLDYRDYADQYGPVPDDQDWIPGHRFPL